MTKQEIVDLFIKKRILSGKSGLVRRPYCWRGRFDEEAQLVFNEYAIAYRSEEEAWFCLCRGIELPICPICHREKVKFTGLTKNGGTGYNTTCEHCSANAVPEKVAKGRSTILGHTEEEKAKIAEKRRRTNQERYGDGCYMAYGTPSFQGLMEERYGTAHYSNIEKRRETCLKRYGVASNLLMPETRRKGIVASWSEACRKRRIENCISRTGRESYCCLPEIQEKMIATKRARIKEIEDAFACTLMAKITKRYGQAYKRLGLKYLRFGGRVYVQNKDIPTIIAYTEEGSHTNKYTSAPEKEVLEFVRSIYKGEVLENCTSVVPNGKHRYYELDIYIPGLRLAIDFDGCYYHSTKFKDRMYHMRKTDFCRKVGVRMIHVFEDGWKKNRANYETIIRECILGTYQNLVRREGDVLIGDNSLPLFGEVEIIGTTAPRLCKVGRLEYYDCGDILYKHKGEHNGEGSQHRQSEVQEVQKSA